MRYRVVCPGCETKLRYDARDHERAAVCPVCERLLRPPDLESAEAYRDEVPPIDAHAMSAGEAPYSSADSIRDVVSLESRMVDLQSEARAFARQYGIPTTERLNTDCGDKLEADLRLASLKNSLPVLPSAYVPSGRLPASAFVWMLAGFGLAVVAGVLTESAVGVISAIVIALIVMLNVAIGACGFIVCFLAILMFIVAAFAYIAPFGAGGWVVAKVTTSMGRLGKNRSQAAARLISIVAAGIASGVFWIIARLVASSWFVQWGIGNDSIWVTFFHILIGGGGIIAMFCAGLYAGDFVQAAKFCETCEEYMEETPLKPLCLGGVKAMSAAIGEGKLPLAASYLTCQSGTDGDLALFACPTCSAGYVDVTVKFRAEWHEANGNKSELAEGWLATSAYLDDSEVEWFRIFSEHEGRDRIGLEQ